jgi:secreted trypsin-like serine protease
MNRIDWVGFAALASLSLSACSSEAPSEARRTTHSNIIGGDNDADRAHVAVVEIKYDDDNDFIGSCTGTIIAPTVVVTAAHCTLPEAPATRNFNYRVFVGTDSTTSDSSNWIPALKAVPNPAYDPNGVGTGAGQDVGVVLLSRPIGIDPIELNRAPLDDSLTEVVAVGWGNDDGNKGTGLDVKRVATLPVVSISDQEVEAGEPGRSTCQGDSGGPWLTTIGGTTKMVGLTSFGLVGCIDTGTATRVDKVMDFLEPFLAGSNAASNNGDDDDDDDVLTGWW